MIRFFSVAITCIVSVGFSSWAHADVVLSLTASPGSLYREDWAPPSPVTITATITNTSVITAADVRLSIIIPSYWEPVQDSETSGASCNDYTDYRGCYHGDSLAWDLGDLSPSGVRHIVIEIEMYSRSLPDSFDNTFLLQADNTWDLLVILPITSSGQPAGPAPTTVTGSVAVLPIPGNNSGGDTDDSGGGGTTVVAPVGCGMGVVGLLVPMLIGCWLLRFPWKCGAIEAYRK